MRTKIYQQNDPSDFSMLTNPKLKLGDIVIVWDNEDGGEWTQARVVDAQFNRHRKCWGYSAVIEFVDDEEHEDRRSMLQDVTYREMHMQIKEWYCFYEDELKEHLLDGTIVSYEGFGFWKHEVRRPFSNLVTPYYIVMKKQ